MVCALNPKRRDPCVRENMMMVCALNPRGELELIPRQAARLRGERKSSQNSRVASRAFLARCRLQSNGRRGIRRGGEDRRRENREEAAVALRWEGSEW